MRIKRKAEFMTIYTFTNKSTKTNNGYADKMNSKFFKKIYEFAPYLKKNNDKPKRDIYHFINNSKSTKPTTVNKTYLFTDAIKFLSSINTEKDNYDFTLRDGTRVTLYDDEIQIGYDFYPLSMFDDIMLCESLPKKTQEYIIEISIKLN